MLTNTIFKYYAYIEGDWHFLIEEKTFSKAFYIRKAGYGNFMLMFELMIIDIDDEKNIIDKNKKLFESCYNEIYCKGEL